MDADLGHPLVNLLARYNRAFRMGDVEGVRRCYVDDDPFIYFDNHAACDAADLDEHLGAVGTFLVTGPVAGLDTEILAVSHRGDAGHLVARVRYRHSDGPPVRCSLFAERHNGDWRIRHLHFSTDPNG
jgi:ketosteroid isomerase-like protein